MSVFWFALAAFVAHYLLTETKAGNWIQASGGNAGAARARGVNVGRTKVLLFMLSLRHGGARRHHSARSAPRPPIPTAAPATSSRSSPWWSSAARLLTGGRGTIIGTVLGIFILRVMRNGIVLVGVPGLAYNIFIGAIILGMMALHSWLERRHNAGT